MVWLTNWNKRKKLNINGTTVSQSAYQMRVNVYYGSGTDSAVKIYCNNNCKGDFSDITFTDTDGISLLNYWIESFVTGVSAIIWVRIPNIPTGTNSAYIYVYYSNPLAVSTSYGLTTFDFFDDFLGTSLDTSKWNIVTRFGYSGNSLSVSNSNVIIQADTNDGYGICAKTSISGNQAFETRGCYILSKPKTNYMSAFITLLQDNTHHVYDNPTGNGYYGEWVESGATHLQKLTSGSASTLKSSSLTMTAGSLYNQSLMLDNSNVTWQINGTNATAQSADLSYRTGLYAGIQLYTSCLVQVDNAFIRKYASPEPVFGTIGAEESGTGTGNLSITSTPSGSRVFINSVDQAVFTPITITGLNPGTYNIKLTQPTYYDYTTTRDISSNQTTLLSATLIFRGGIVNPTFDSNLNGWSTSGNSTTFWQNGKAHVRSNSQWGASVEQFAYFYQTFLLDNQVLKFDIQPSISGDTDYACGDCISSPGDYFPIADTCGWALKDNSGNVISHAYVNGTNLQTFSLDLSNYVGQYLKISFQAGASTGYGYYYDLLVDNVMTSPGIFFNPICSDTGQHCNAILYMDDNYQGTTPYRIAPSIGTHSYTLYKAGYARYDGTINVTSSTITDGATLEPTLTPDGGIINGTFDNFLNGWTVSGAATWDNGRVHLTYNASISQIFAISDDVVQFDYETIGWDPNSSGLGYQVYIDGVLKIDKILPGNYGNPLYGTEQVYLGNYIGRTAKILFHEIYNWEGWIDNVSISHMKGIYNGDFSNGFIGWETSGEISIRNCGDWPARWGAPCSGTYAQVGINDGGTISQTFILDKCQLKFDWMSGYSQKYEIYNGNTLIISKSLPQDTQGTETVDLRNYIGNTLTITFYSYQFLAIDNVTTITNPFDVSIISYPSGAEIYLDGNDTGQTTTDTPVVIDGTSDGPHTITLKLTGYTDYIEDINITRCETTYVNAVFAGCITFITSPVGAGICIDNIDTGFITPKTICYKPGDTHSYILTLEDYRSASAIIILPSDKGVLINDILTFNTGSASFNVTPNGSKILIDGNDTGKLTPDIVDNLPIGYHSYEIRNNNYYSLTGSFRSIVDKVKPITGSLQQITGVVNGTFDTDLNGWTVTTTDPTKGYVEWINGTAHLYNNLPGNAPLIFYQDFVPTEDIIVFNFHPAVILNTYCGIGWSIIANPDTADQETISSYCGWGESSEHWGYFEVDVGMYKGKTVRLSFSIVGQKIFYIGGPSEAYLDNVGNVPKLTRSVTFDTFCAKYSSCLLNPIVDQCYADIYLDGNLIGTNPIQVDYLTLTNHSYIERNQGYLSVDAPNTQDTTGTISFSQGIPAHIYIDGLYTPGPLVPGEGCVYIDSSPQGAEIFVDGNDSGVITPNVVCGLSLTNHNYELKLLNHTAYKGTFLLGKDFGEYISVIITGHVYFNSIPSGANIYLDGNYLGLTTPSLVKNISPGYHTFTLTLPPYNDFTGTIYVLGEPQ